MNISIVLPVYNNTEYVIESISSIYKSGINIDYELLIGIDGCKQTLELFKDLEVNEKTKVFFFEKNVGPYIIRNSLFLKSRFENVVFFDSDDIMCETMLYSIGSGLNNYDVIYPKMKNFIKKGDEFLEVNKRREWGGGVFGIKKSVFSELNGFEPWFVGADTEFNQRLLFNRKKIIKLNKVLFFRRIHNTNLTTSKETGFNSELRQSYVLKLKNKKDFGPLKTLYSEDSKEIFTTKKIKINNLNTFVIGKNKSDLSIIIPTYKNTQYIDECLYSIFESGINQNIEVLVGIDGCQETLEYIKTKSYPDFVKFYYFNENNGPYLIKNSLTKIANSDNLLFFDSDDIMLPGTIREVIEKLQTYDCVRLKYNNHINNKPDTTKTNFGEGVVAIKKELVLEMNGFEPWRVAADSEFMGRLYKRNPKIYHTKNVTFYYRQHPTSLTKRPDTGMSSQLRASYAKQLKNKSNPNILHIAKFEPVDITKFEVIKEVDYNKLIRDEKLNKVLNPTPRKVVSKKVELGSPVILDNLDVLVKNNPKPVQTIKPNQPNNRQELIDLKNSFKTTLKDLFPKKQNPRDGKNFINLGGKIHR